MNACNFRFDLCPLTPLQAALLFPHPFARTHDSAPAHSTTPPQGCQPQICYASLCVCVGVCDAAGRPSIAENAKRRQYISADGGGQPFSVLLRAGFITLGVRKIKIVPLSQKHAQQYTNTHAHALTVCACVCVCVSVWRGNQPAVANCRKKGQAKQKNRPLVRGRRGQGEWQRRGQQGAAGWAQMCSALFVARARLPPRLRNCLHNQSCYPCFAYSLTHSDTHADTH